MNTEVRQALDKIDDILMELPRPFRQDLVNVLSALRGPDDGDVAVKTASTAVIRSVALPRTNARNYDVGGKSFSMLNQEVNPTKQTISEADILAQGRHFRSHIRLAADALGIWDGISSW